jgi:putative heme iron utilization protein
MNLPYQSGNRRVREIAAIFGKNMTETEFTPPAALLPAVQARRLMRSCDRATLATALRDEAGWPYGSLVLSAADNDGSPILLLSDLAEHSQNLAKDPRVSLLFDGTAGHDDPLTGARVTVLGELARTPPDQVRRRFLARHPGAEMYADFADFHFYRLSTTRAHLVAGFGAIDWIDDTNLTFDTAKVQPLIEAETDITDHMNHDHADAIDAYAHGLLGLSGDGWHMTGIDAEGIDLRRRGSVARLNFDHPVTEPAEARATLVALADTARTKTDTKKRDSDA